MRDKIKAWLADECNQEFCWRIAAAVGIAMLLGVGQAFAVPFHNSGWCGTWVYIFFC